MPDIIYILPADSGPVGGVKVQLQHVRMLRQAGFSAEAYALANFHDWYDAGFPVTIFGQQTHWIRPGSIVVFPETELPRLKQRLKKKPNARFAVYLLSTMVKKVHAWLPANHPSSA